MDKQQAWDYALGIIKVDGLEPSPEFLAMAEKEKRDELTLEDIKRTLDAKYTLKAESVPNEWYSIYPHSRMSHYRRYNLRGL